MYVITFKFIRNYFKGNVSFKYALKSVTKSVNSGNKLFHMSSNVDDLNSGKKSFVDDTSVVVIVNADNSHFGQAMIRKLHSRSRLSALRVVFLAKI